MRPLWTLRFALLAILLWLWPVEQPSEREYMAYLREKDKPDPLKSPFYVSMIRTQEMAAITAETARDLQRYIDQHQSQPGPYEPPQQRTDAISLKEMRAAYHKARLLPIDSMEMEAIIETEKRSVIHP